MIKEKKIIPVAVNIRNPDDLERPEPNSLQKAFMKISHKYREKMELKNRDLSVLIKPLELKDGSVFVPILESDLVQYGYGANIHYKREALTEEDKAFTLRAIERTFSTNAGSNALEEAVKKGYSFGSSQNLGTALGVCYHNKKAILLNNRSLGDINDFITLTHECRHAGQNLEKEGVYSGKYDSTIRATLNTEAMDEGSAQVAGLKAALDYGEKTGDRRPAVYFICHNPYVAHAYLDSKLKNMPEETCLYNAVKSWGKDKEYSDLYMEKTEKSLRYATGNWYDVGHKYKFSKELDGEKAKEVLFRPIENNGNNFCQVKPTDLENEHFVTLTEERSRCLNLFFERWAESARTCAYKKNFEAINKNKDYIKDIKEVSKDSVLSRYETISQATKYLGEYFEKAQNGYFKNNIKTDDTQKNVNNIILQKKLDNLVK